jgi:hypothetical protein
MAKTFPSEGAVVVNTTTDVGTLKLPLRSELPLSIFSQFARMSSMLNVGQYVSRLFMSCPSSRTSNVILRVQVPQI